MSRTKKLGIACAVLAVFIFVLNIFAMQRSWYFFVWWFDMPMHALGGFFIAILASFLALSNRFLRTSNSRKFFMRTMLVVFVIGILWEVFELSVEKTVEFAELVSLKDSVSDIFFDLAGGILGVSWGMSIFLKEKINLNGKQ